LRSIPGGEKEIQSGQCDVLVRGRRRERTRTP
jgi:hypothetical protein